MFTFNENNLLSVFLYTKEKWKGREGMSSYHNGPYQTKET